MHDAGVAVAAPEQQPAEDPGGSRATRLAAAIGLVALAGVWSWWGAKEGAYFDAVMYPGVVVLAAAFVLVSSRAAAPFRVMLPWPARVAVAALVALAGWSALSAIWSPAPEIAVTDAQRILGYALAFGLGLWVVTLLRERVHLALAPLAVAGLFAGMVALIALLTGDDYGRYIDEGTLQHPIGYRNANAAFFAIAMWPALALAATRELDWRLRGLALGTATLCLELAMLSQSRGSLVGGVVALAVYVAISPARARATGWLALAVLPALIAIPSVTDLFQTRDIDDYTGTAELRAAGRAALGGAGLALALGAASAWIGRRITPSEQRARLANRAVGAGAIAAVLAGAVGFVIATGDPAEWIDDRVDEFLTQGTPGDQASTRFGVNAGSERDDFWRVALEEAEADPIVGTGGGGYGYAYLLRRSEEGTESVRDAHSAPLEVLSELGAPGLVLFVVTLGAAGAGAWRGRRLGPEAAGLSAAALTVGAYWLGHASLDWFWTYAGVTAPVFALLGAACGLGTSNSRESGGPTLVRRLATAAAVLLALTMVPPYLADRYVDAAYGGWRSDLERAQDDLERAQDLNPLSIEPLLAEGAIAREGGNRDRAIAAFEEAAAERPEDWTSRYFLTELNLRSNPQRARAELAAALALNPLSPDLVELRERLRNLRN